MKYFAFFCVCCSFSIVNASYEYFGIGNIGNIFHFTYDPYAETLIIPNSNKHQLLVYKIPTFQLNAIAGMESVSGDTTNVNGNQARFNNPVSTALVYDKWTLEASGYLVVEYSGHCVRHINSNSPYYVTTVAGVCGTSGTSNGIGSNSRFNTPYNIALDKDNLRYAVADTNNGCIRLLTMNTKNNFSVPVNVSTIAGICGNSGRNATSGNSLSTKLSSPQSVVFLPLSNDVLIIAESTTKSVFRLVGISSIRGGHMSIINDITSTSVLGYLFIVPAPNRTQQSRLYLTSGGGFSNNIFVGNISFSEIENTSTSYSLTLTRLACNGYSSNTRTTIVLPNGTMIQSYVSSPESINRLKEQDCDRNAYDTSLLYPVFNSLSFSRTKTIKSRTGSITKTGTRTLSRTLSTTLSNTPSRTLSRTLSKTLSITQSNTLSRSLSRTPSKTLSITQSNTLSRSLSRTLSKTLSKTPSRTLSKTPLITASKTPLITASTTFTKTLTKTLSNMLTKTLSNMLTNTLSKTASITLPKTSSISRVNVKSLTKTEYNKPKPILISENKAVQVTGIVTTTMASIISSTIVSNSVRFRIINSILLDENCKKNPEEIPIVSENPLQLSFPEDSEAKNFIGLVVGDFAFIIGTTLLYTGIAKAVHCYKKSKDKKEMTIGQFIKDYYIGDVIMILLGTLITPMVTCVFLLVYNNDNDYPYLRGTLVYTSLFIFLILFLLMYIYILKRKSDLMEYKRLKKETFVEKLLKNDGEWQVLENRCNNVMSNELHISTFLINGYTEKCPYFAFIDFTFMFLLAIPDIISYYSSESVSCDINVYSLISLLVVYFLLLVILRPIHPPLMLLTTLFCVLSQIAICVAKVASKEKDIETELSIVLVCTLYIPIISPIILTIYNHFKEKDDEIANENDNFDIEPLLSIVLSDTEMTPVVVEI
jgi:hypothetical protein